MKSLEQLSEEQQRPFQLLAQVRREFAGWPGVVAVGIGFRRTAGVISDEIVFRVFVEEKLPREHVAASKRIPRMLHGVSTDVTQVADTFLSLQGTVEEMEQAEGEKVATLVGGVSIMPDDAIVAGTLGCFARLRSDPTTRVLLTNSHNLYGPKDDPTKPGRPVGQPDISSTGCCRTGVIGRALRGVREGLVDAAIATLNGRRPIDQRLPGIGPDANGKNEDLITGVPQPMLQLADVDLNPDTPPVQVRTNVRVGETVRKVGRSTQVTTGVVTDIGIPAKKKASREYPLDRSYTEQILIRPESGGEGTDRRISFGVAGDSGAVVVNRFNQVVALLHGANPNPDHPDNQERFFMWGLASQIHHVCDQLQIDVFASGAANRAGIPDVVVPTNAIVPGTAIVTRSMTPEDEARGALLDEVVAQLRQSASGRLVLWLYDTHHREVQALLAHDRRVKVAWHRNHGPALVARLLSGPQGLDQPIPREIDGVRLEDGFRRVLDVLVQRGSEALQADVSRHAPAALALLAASTTVRDALERVNAQGRPA